MPSGATSRCTAAARAATAKERKKVKGKREERRASPSSSLLPFTFYLFPSVLARLAAGLQFQTNVSDGHSLINCLAHVVDGEGGYRCGCQCFHLNTCLRLSRCFGFNHHARLCYLCADINVVERKRVAERDEFRCSLGCHDSCEPCCLERIALRRAMLAHSPDGFSRHENLCRSYGASSSYDFRARINHLHAPLLIHVRKTFHSLESKHQTRAKGKMSVPLARRRWY